MNASLHTDRPTAMAGRVKPGHDVRALRQVDAR